MEQDVPERKCAVVDLGLTDYAACLDIQRRLLSLRQQSKIYDALILTEHYPVITFGRGFRGEVPELPVPAYQIERGGEGTFHSPGQFVAYPVMNISENRVGVRTLVLRILESAVYALEKQGVEAEARVSPVGVWTGGKKIGSLGIAVKRWVTFHGLAVNLNNDLGGFSHINPCGMSPSTMTSAKKLLGREADTARFRQDFVDSFMESFHFSPESLGIEGMPGFGVDTAV